MFRFIGTIIGPNTNVAEFLISILILITDTGSVIDRINCCIIAKHNGMAPIGSVTAGLIVSFFFFNYTEEGGCKLIQKCGNYLLSYKT
jgi:hypothetical protein